MSPGDQGDQAGAARGEDEAGAPRVATPAPLVAEPLPAPEPMVPHAVALAPEPLPAPAPLPAPEPLPAPAMLLPPGAQAPAPATAEPAAPEPAAAAPGAPEPGREVRAAHAPVPVLRFERKPPPAGAPDAAPAGEAAPDPAALPADAAPTPAPAEAAPATPAAVAAPPGPAAAPTPDAAPRPDRTAPFLEGAALLGTTGASLGMLVWTGLNSARLVPYAHANQLDPVSRRWLLVAMLCTGAAFAAVTWLATALGEDGSVGRFRKAAARLSPLAVVGVFPLLFNWAVWQGRELASLTLILGTALLFERAVRASLEAGPCLLPTKAAGFVDGFWSFLAERRALRHLPLATVLAAAAGYAVYFSVFTLRNHYRLSTSAFDLGVENSVLWNAAHFNAPLFKTSALGGPHASHAGYHQTFISYLLGLPYRLWPKPEALLVLQSTVIAAAALPLHVWAREKIGHWPAALLALAYLVYPPLHGSNLYDFHYQPFGPFFLWTSLLLLERGRWGWAGLMVLLTLSLREDMSLMLLVIGGYLVLTRARPRVGVALAVACAAVFVVQKMIIMPRLLGGFSAYINQYQGLLPEGDTGFGGVVKTVLANPAFTLQSLLEPPKLTYALHVFAPLALLPLRRPLGFWLAVPGFFFTLLATQYPPLLHISFQYTAYWSMFVFPAAGYALWKTADPARRRARVAALVLASGCATFVWGAITQPNAARGAWDVHHLTLTPEDHRRHADAYFLIDQIPPDAKAAASERLNPHISSRADGYTMRGTIHDAEWVVFELGALGPNEKASILGPLERNELGLVADRGGFFLLKRGAPTTRNAELLPRLR